ncbi:MAG: ABC transporter ATP-binding protein [Chromatiaceae bacterium]|jgi:ABC-2 type transport system ATP-binding protein
MEILLRARAISYGPKRRPRLTDIDLELQPGERLGLLGVNGAGKSTLMQVLAGVLAPSRGEVFVLGRPLRLAPPSLRRHIGFLPQRVPAYPELTVTENLAWAGRLRGLRHQALQSAIDDALQQVQLGGVATRLAGSLSAGMAQRLGLAQAVLHHPDILILDEPTAGLDPLQTQQIRGLLQQLSAKRSLILSTHLLDDVQLLCSSVILIDNGRKTAQHAVTAETDLLAHFRQHANADLLGAGT